MQYNKKIRVRFAPSPTGPLHIGGARTALFCYLFARHNQGKYLLRIEDSDRSRSSHEMKDSILTSLRWLNLNWDEEIVYQSKRFDRYRQIAENLLKKGKAYYCFCTSEELTDRKKSSQKGAFEYKYDRKCFDLPIEQVESNIKKGLPKTIRFKVSEGKTAFKDIIHGSTTFNNKEIDDFVIMRSDGTPVYHLAVVVDDYDMQITHVIRGDDHLSNTPKQIQIYKAMEWSIPQFAHVPMIWGDDNKRLSKRHGATSIHEYQKEGYLSESLVNYLALLGWAPGDNREIISKEELIDIFELERVSKKPAIFDETKLTWMNGQYISLMKETDILDDVVNILVDSNIINQEFVKINQQYLIQFIKIMKSRVKKLTDFALKGIYFFKDPEVYNEKAINKYWKKDDVPERLIIITNHLKDVLKWEESVLEKVIRDTAIQMNIGAGKLIHPIRLAITGTDSSPGLFEMMEVLKKSSVLRRLNRAINYLKSL
jgi:glutamyl-tRNA synthetase